MITIDIEKAKAAKERLGRERQDREERLKVALEAKAKFGKELQQRMIF